MTNWKRKRNLKGYWDPKTDGDKMNEWNSLVERRNKIAKIEKMFENFFAIAELLEDHPDQELEKEAYMILESLSKEIGDFNDWVLFFRSGRQKQCNPYASCGCRWDRIL